MSTFMSSFEGIADTEYPDCRRTSGASQRPRDSRSVSFTQRDNRSDNRTPKPSFSARTASPGPERSLPNPRPTTPDPGPRRCFKCGSPAHLQNSRECPRADPAIARSSTGPKVQALEADEVGEEDENVESPDEGDIDSWDGNTQALEIVESSDESESFSESERCTEEAHPYDFAVQALEVNLNDDTHAVSRRTLYDETGYWSDDFYPGSDHGSLPDLEEAPESPVHSTSGNIIPGPLDDASSSSVSSSHSSQLYELCEWEESHHPRRNYFNYNRGYTPRAVVEARRVAFRSSRNEASADFRGNETIEWLESFGQDFCLMEDTETCPSPPVPAPTSELTSDVELTRLEQVDSRDSSDGSWGMPSSVNLIDEEVPEVPSQELWEGFGDDFCQLEANVTRLWTSALDLAGAYSFVPIRPEAFHPVTDNLPERHSWNHLFVESRESFGSRNLLPGMAFVDDAILRGQSEEAQENAAWLFSPDNVLREDPLDWQVTPYVEPPTLRPHSPRPIALPQPRRFGDSYFKMTQCPDIATFHSLPSFDITDPDFRVTIVDVSSLFVHREGSLVLPYYTELAFPLPWSLQELRALYYDMRRSVVPHDLYDEEDGHWSLSEDVWAMLDEEFERYSPLVNLTDISQLTRRRNLRLWRRLIQRWLGSHRDILPLHEGEPEERALYLGLLKTLERNTGATPIETTFEDSDTESDEGISILALEHESPDFEVSTLEPPAGITDSAQLAEAGGPVLLSSSEAQACFASKPSRDAPMNSKRLQKGMAYKAGFSVVTRVILQGKPILVTLDTGAAPTVIGASTLGRIDADYATKLLPLKGISRTFQAFNSTLNALGIYECPLTFPHPSGNIRLNVELVVMERSATHDWFILGCDWLAPYGFNLMFGHSPSFTIGAFKQRFAIAPRSKQPRLTYADLAATVATPSSSTEGVTQNYTSEVAALSATEGTVSQEPEAFEDALKLMNINPALTSEQRHELETVIRRHPMAFAHGKHQLGYVSSHLCKVEFNPDAKPVNLRSSAFPQSPRSRDAMRKCLDEFLALGIIQPSKSRYAAPAFIVYQNDKPRMVVNFKNLNTVVAGDAYPLPRIDSTLFNLKDSKYLTSLDANKGFYQISVFGEHVERLAFITEFGLFEFLRMPMGFKNSPATFQRGMDQHFHEAIRAGWFTVYVDDLLLKAKTWEDHMQNLEVTLRTLELNGWTMNPAKCYFAYGEVRQLGHQVSGLLLGIDENKIAAVRDLKIPNNRKELHSWIGFTGYFRKFIMDFSKIAKPLTNLLKQETVWNWTDECTEAHDEIKRRLLTAPLLGQPDFTKPFRLYVDASADGLGAVLQQMQTINDKPIEVVICFISRQLRGAENRYGATQLEALGLVWALKKLYVFLDGSFFEVITDCIAIRSLLDMKTPNRHMLRWQLAIQEFRGRMTILHREGRTHLNADGMRRMALPNDASNPAADLSGEPKAAVHALSFVELDDEFFATIKASYALDDDIRRIHTALLSPESDPTAILSGLKGDLRAQFDAGRFFLLDELLYRRKGAAVALVICDPETRGAVISACHDQVTAGHLGLEKTYARLRPLAWWPGAYTDTLEYIKSCDACQRANKHTGKPYGLAQRIEEAKSPWELINMDFVTGFPPGGSEGFNAVLVVVDRFSRRARFLPTFVDADAKFTAGLFYRQIMSEHGVPAGIISDRDKLFTSDFWKHLAALCGFKLKLSTSYHPQTDGLAERFIGSLEDMLRRFVSFGPTWTDELGFTHDWIELLPGLEFALNSSVHTGLQRAPFVVERGHIPRSIYSLITDRLPSLPVDPSSSNFAKMLTSAHSRALECISASVDAATARWDAHHAPPPFQVGDTVMISTKHFNFSGPSKLIPPFVGPFAVTKEVGPNAIRVALTAPYDRKHPVFPVSLAKLHIPGDPDRFPGRRQAAAPQPDIIDGTPEWVVEKILDQRRRPPRGRKRTSEVEYEVKWEGYGDEYNRWLTEDKLYNAKDKLREYRESRRATTSDAMPATTILAPANTTTILAPANNSTNKRAQTRTPAREDTSHLPGGGGVRVSAAADTSERPRRHIKAPQPFHPPAP